MAAKKITKTTGPRKDLPAALDDLTRAILLNSDFEHPWKRMGVAFGRGVLYGLGVLTAVAVVFPFIILMLNMVDWVPVLGDFFADVSNRIEEAQTSR